MENKVEGARPLAFMLSEGNGKISRDVVTIPAGTGKIEPGTVLGEITADETYIPSPAALVVGKEGAEVGKAINCYAVDATDAAVDAVVISGHAEVKTPEIKFDTSVNDATKQAAKLDELRAVNIKAR